MSNRFPLPNLPAVNWNERPVVNPVPEITSVTNWDARLATEAPRVPFDVFLTDYFPWRQGEHVAVIGPTGQGKTTLLMALLPLHPYVVVFATKPHDESMTDLITSGGYYRLSRWESLPVDHYPRRVLWPDATKLDSVVSQKAVFTDALERIYRERGWTVVIDEGWYFSNMLGLDKALKTYLLQARSLSISLVLATQRPAWVPVEVYDQSTYLFLYRDNDERNLSRLSGISYRSASLIRYIVSNLEQYQLLFINTRTGQMCRTRAPAPTIREAADDYS